MTFVISSFLLVMGVRCVCVGALHFEQIGNHHVLVAEPQVIRVG